MDGVFTAVFLLPCVAVAAIAYALGCLNGAIITSKYVFGEDVRTHGSGNAGLTNFYRTYGTKGVIGVLAIDILKGVLAAAIGGILLGHFLGMPMIGKLLGMMCVLLGHMYPVSYGFRGGKGILTGVSAGLVVDWRVALIAFAVFLLFACVTKYISLGSVLSLVTFLAALWGFHHSVTYEVMCAIPVALMIYAHRSNIDRLLHGTENKFSVHKKDGAAK